MSYLGLEIGATKLQLVLGGSDGVITDRQRAAVNLLEGAAGIRAQISAMIANWRGQYQWQAVGVGYGGPVDQEQGLIVKSYHVAGWDGYPLGPWLEKEANAPVFLENDTNAAALAEGVYGAGHGANPVFYTNSGSGVGGGLVVDGKLYRGAKPGECEIGHVRLDREGTIVEDRCSGWALDRAVAAHVRAHPQGALAVLAQDAPHGASARLLAPALAQGDAHAAAIVEEAAGWYALALSHAVHLFHPQRIVLGGGVSLIGEPWRAGIARHLQPLLMASFQPPPDIVLSRFGEDAVPIGALVLAAGITA